MTAEGQVQCSCRSGWKLDVDLRSCVGETFSFCFRRICGAAGDVTTLCLIAVGAQTHFPVYQQHRGGGTLGGLQGVLSVQLLLLFVERCE